VDRSANQPTAPSRAGSQRRNRGFEQTHRELIEAAVRLISERGADALSVAALARAAGINRTTVYYHFDSREALLAAVKEWSNEQIVRGMDLASPRVERIGEISSFVLENPELIKLWIDDFVGGSDIRASYPRWEELVAGIRRSFAAAGEDVDAEVYCAMLLSAAIIGPHVFRTAVAPNEDLKEIAERFIAEHLRVIGRDGLS
jgi:AcrR family transcriptional regulator